MLKIDAHQHFWTYDPVRDNWIGEDMAILQDDFMPEHLQPILEHYGFQGSVVVQSGQSAIENNFQLKNAEQYPFIKGIVGWVDFESTDLSEQLAFYKDYPKLKGFRHILQGEKDRAIMLSPAYKSGITKLESFGYTYDLLVLPDQLGYAIDLVKMFPNQRFVLDHIGKPDIKNQDIKDWAEQIKTLGSLENVYCKVSGMVTEANVRNWKVQDFTPFLEVVFEAFGCKRLMFGSDWPVCRVAGTYGQVISLLEQYISTCSSSEQEMFWGGTAIEFYNL
jgi:L-fuconolactonase